MRTIYIGVCYCVNSIYYTKRNIYTFNLCFKKNTLSQGNIEKDLYKGNVTIM
jgi:hypothetical protein